MFKDIHHIAVICSDYQKSKDFYINKLGFQKTRESYREDKDSFKLDLRLENIRIELFTFPNPPKRASYPEALGLRHIAFSVENVKIAKLELEEKGVEVEGIRTDELTGKKYAFFKDPDGLPIEIYEL